MDKQELISELYKTIIDIYEENGLLSLRGENYSYELNGRQILAWYTEVTHWGRKTYSKNIEFHKIFDELIFCSDEIMYFLANMFLYKPFINNPIKDGFAFGDKIVYPNRQNLESKRYNMFSNIVSEKIYNYWDRIGDLIAIYFPDKIKPQNVYFTSAIEIVPKEFHHSENYIWLKNFKETDYKKLNQKRKQIVHYSTVDTDFKYKLLGNSTNREHVGKIIEERDSLTDFYKYQFNLTLTGFEKTILLLEEITERKKEEIT